MHHPHVDEMTPMAMGMMGLWITHPRDPKFTPGYTPVDRDFCFLLNAFDIEPGSATPKIMTMLDFNLWCWNSRVFPGIDSLAVRLGDRVRIRVGNLTMTGQGPMGALEMGGMFTTIKVREGLGRNDYKDPGWYKHPAGTVAYEWTGQPQNPERAPSSRTDGSEVQHHRGADWRARKPQGRHEH
jgi:FtsP/CotA-like multicopper oxidase with cupredoxin domain